MNQHTAAQCPEHRATGKRMSRGTEMLVAIDIERGATQPREIVEARRVLIAELEQRRRLPCDWGHGLIEGAELST
jgi:hypothetical protein